MARNFTREDRANVLYSHVDADAELAVLQAAIREAVTRLVEAHAAAGRASEALVKANRVVSQIGCRAEVAA